MRTIKAKCGFRVQEIRHNGKKAYHLEDGYERVTGVAIATQNEMIYMLAEFDEMHKVVGKLTTTDGRKWIVWKDELLRIMYMTEYNA